MGAFRRSWRCSTRRSERVLFVCQDAFRAGLGFAGGRGGRLAVAWVRAREWNLTNIMLIWTGAIIVNIIGGIMAPFDIQQFRQQIGR